MASYLKRLKQFQKQPTEAIPAPSPKGTSEQPLSPNHESAIRTWLASVGEHDEQIIGEVLTMSAADPAALTYYLDRATEGRREAA